jgi:hypothetical protein
MVAVGMSNAWWQVSMCMSVHVASVEITSRLIERK